MSEPLKPRIDFDGPLQGKNAPLKSARAFDRLEADNFAPARLVTGEEEEGRQRRWWSRCCGRNAVCGGGWSALAAIFGVSVVAQRVQWTANARQTQDWIALGGCVAGR